MSERKCECRVVQSCTEKDHSINRRSHYLACFTVQHVGECARSAEYREENERLKRELAGWQQSERDARSELAAEVVGGGIESDRAKEYREALEKLVKAVPVIVKAWTTHAATWPEWATAVNALDDARRVLAKEE